MIKNIVFDMGNVILRWDPEYIANKLSNNLNEQRVIIKELFNSRQWQMLDQGTISLDEALQQIYLQTNKEYHDLLKYALYHWYDYLEIFDEMVPLIKELKQQDYKIYLLSNCGLQIKDYFHKVAAFKYFDDFYISAHNHLLKPDIQIYKHFLTKFNLVAEECIFIDDILVNVEGAKRVGMSAYLYDGNIDDLRSFLKKSISMINY